MPELDFSILKQGANGMLSAEAYRAIYEAARNITEGDVLDIGTAHGAAAIAAALGLKNGKVYTVDKIAGGSRDQFGDVEANIKIIRSNFEKFAVDKKIEFILGSSRDIAPQLPQNLKIGLLILDADGAVDRDFKLFYDRVLPGAAIVIDDYQPEFVRIYNRGKTLRVDQKRRLTALLAHHFELKGYLERTGVIGETYIGRKPQNAPSITEIDDEEIYDLYRDLIFANGQAHSRAAEFINKVTRKFPALHKALKKIYMAAKTRPPSSGIH